MGSIYYSEKAYKVLQTLGRKKEPPHELVYEVLVGKDDWGQDIVTHMSKSEWIALQKKTNPSVEDLKKQIKSLEKENKILNTMLELCHADEDERYFEETGDNIAEYSDWYKSYREDAEEWLK